MSEAALIRPAVPEDAARIAEIYNEGIAERRATFETRPREPEEVVEWIEGRRPILVAERNGRVLGFARVTPYSTRPVYAGVGEQGVYVDRAERGIGIGSQLLAELARAAEAAGLYKLTARIFTTNEPSIAAHRAAGFEVVGIQRRHGRLDGEWLDCVLMERLLGEALEP